MSIEKAMEYSGISGLISAFRDSMSNVGNVLKIAFVGSVGVCTPFAELMAYSIREQRHEMVFKPDANVDNTRKMHFIEGVGYYVTDEAADARGSDIIVILGGLSMKRHPCTGEAIRKLIECIERDDGATRVIGVSFMNAFKISGWVDKIKFDVIIDTHSTTIVRYQTHE